MSDVTVKDKTLGEQMWDLLVRNPENYDVTFSVGLEKKEVKAVKFLLKAASRVFQKQFQDNWEKAVMKDGEGIPLKDVDPTAFQLLIKLLIQDKWSIDVLQSLNLTPNTLLSLLEICRRFEITKAIKNLENEVDQLLSAFVEFKDTDGFLQLTQPNLGALLSSENIPMEEKDIFNCACRWAEFQCSLKELETTGENIRDALGPCLFEIRFPVMSCRDFTRVGRWKSNLLKADEKLTIFEFIGLDEDERLTFDKSQLLFQTHPRKPKLRYSTLSLTKNFKIHKNLPFVCDGKEIRNLIQISNGRIAFHGIGFFGPVLADSYYDVTIEIKNFFNGNHCSPNGKLEKRLFARKEEIFYFIFDTPVVLEPVKDESTWNRYECNAIYFTLKGPDTMAVDRKPGPEGPVEEEGIKFRYYWEGGKNQFAEYLYTKL